MKLVIGFSKAKSPWALGSKAIQIGESRPYSHAYVRYDSPLTSVSVVCQASHGMVNMMNFDVFKEANEIVEEHCLSIDPERFKILKTFIDTNVGKPYSQMQIVLLSIKKLLHLEIKYSNGNSAFICSEWVAEVLKCIGMLNSVPDQDYLTPSDLHKLLGFD